MIAPTTTIATAVRVEHNQETGELFLVFKVIDENFRKRIIEDWMQDIQVQLIGKDLYAK